MTEGARVAALVLVAALAIACRKSEGTAPPDAAAPAEETAASADDPLGAPEQALADNAARLRELGIVLESDEQKRLKTSDEVPAAEPTKPAPKNFESAATRCDELCGLADTACGLRVQICGLAQDHVGESRYEAACWRATDQCTRASAACDDCKGGTPGAAGSCRPG